MADKAGSSSSSSRKKAIRGAQAKELEERNKLVEELVELSSEMRDAERKFYNKQRNVQRHFDQIGTMQTIIVDTEDHLNSLGQFFATRNVNGLQTWQGTVIVGGENKGEKEERVQQIVLEYNGERLKDKVTVIQAHD